MYACVWEGSGENIRDEMSQIDSKYETFIHLASITIITIRKFKLLCTIKLNLER